MQNETSRSHSAFIEYIFILSIKKFIEYNLNCMNDSTSSTQLSNRLLRSKFLKSIRDKLTSICLSIDASSTTLSTWSDDILHK